MVKTGESTADSGPGRGDTFLSLKWGQPGVLYEPLEECQGVALLYMHPTADFITWEKGFLTHRGARRLTERGYHVLLSNTREHTFGDFFFHDLLKDVGTAVKYLRSRDDIDTILLGGQSGGAHLMAAYENVAENGPGTWQGDMLHECPDDFEGLPTADGIVLFDAHLGYGPLTLLRLGPTVVSEENPRLRDSSVDIYDQGNGFQQEGTTYSQKFRDRFFRRQADRMRKLINIAEHKRERLEAGCGPYPDDQPLVVPDQRTNIGDVDTQLLSHTDNEWLLVRPDEPAREEIIERTDPADHDFGEDLNLSYAADSEPPLTYRGKEVLSTTVRKFLSTHAVRPTDEYEITESKISGIDWSTSYTCLPANLANISIPLLQIGMTGSHLLVQNETAFSSAGSSDRELVFVEGANHFYKPIASQYGDTVGATYDYVAQWIQERF